MKEERRNREVKRRIEGTRGAGREEERGVEGRRRRIGRGEGGGRRGERELMQIGEMKSQGTTTRRGGGTMIEKRGLTAVSRSVLRCLLVVFDVLWCPFGVL